jgi:hypothetical protein
MVRAQNNQADSRHWSSLEIETVLFAKLCVRLGDLCGFALSSSLTAKYAKDFAKKRKANCTSTRQPVELSQPNHAVRIDAEQLQRLSKRLEAVLLSPPTISRCPNPIRHGTP